MTRTSSPFWICDLPKTRQSPEGREDNSYTLSLVTNLSRKARKPSSARTADLAALLLSEPSGYLRRLRSGTAAVVIVVHRPRRDAAAPHFVLREPGFFG